jgi:hypothetical protein
VDRFLAGAALVTAARCFAIERYHLPLRHPEHRFHPAHEPDLERLTVDFGKHIPERVMRRDAIFQLEKLSKPRFFRPRHRLDPHPAIRSTQRRAHRDDENVHQFMVASPPHTRVGQVAEAGFQTQAFVIVHRTFPRFSRLSSFLHFEAIILPGRKERQGIWFDLGVLCVLAVIY